MPEVKGIPVAPGLAFGRVHIVRSRPDSVPLWTVPGEAVQGEIDRLGAALDAVRDQLGRQQEIVRRTTGEQDAAIFAVHRAILEDPTAVAQVERRLVEAVAVRLGLGGGPQILPGPDGLRLLAARSERG